MLRSDGAKAVALAQTDFVAYDLHGHEEVAIFLFFRKIADSEWT